MSEHTPGPWELRQSTRHGYFFIDYPQQEGSATLTKLDCDEADARLISAAPDLLEVLRDVREAWLAGRMRDVDGILTGDVCTDAIAKATGQEV
jgi:hypothetical protein